MVFTMATRQDRNQARTAERFAPLITLAAARWRSRAISRRLRARAISAGARSYKSCEYGGGVGGGLLPSPHRESDFQPRAPPDSTLHGHAIEETHGDRLAAHINALDW